MDFSDEEERRGETGLISMPICNGDIRAYISFLVDTVKARGGTTSRGTRSDAVMRCLTFRLQVVTTARRRRCRSRVNRTGNDACSHARNQRRIATPPDCTCTKVIDNVAADRNTGSTRACRRISLLTRMRNINSAADETIEGEQKRHSWGERYHVPTNECVWLKRMQRQGQSHSFYS